MTFKEWLKDQGACKEIIKFTGDKTLKEVWEQCPRGDWLLWLYVRLYPDNIKERVLAAGHCANTVRHLMEDKRSRDAVDAAIKFGEGEIGREKLDDAAFAADDSAGDAALAASAAAAYAIATKANQKKTADICRKYLTVDYDMFESDSARPSSEPSLFE